MSKEIIPISFHKFQADALRDCKDKSGESMASIVRSAVSIYLGLCADE